MRSKSGFTLIELLIAIVILAGMTTITAISIQRGVKLKVKLEKDIDDDSQLREVVSLISKDLSLAFHWTDINETIKKQISYEAKSQNKPDPIPTPGQQGTIIPAEQLTYLMGEKDSLYFTSLSHQRTQKDSQESEQAKIGYFLQTKRSFKDQKSSTTLFRSVDPFLDGDYKKKGKETALLENIKSLKFKYLPDDIKEISDGNFLDSWRSMESGDEKQKGKFPAAIQVEIEIEKDGKTSQIKSLVSIHNPANEPFKFPNPTPSPGAPVSR